MSACTVELRTNARHGMGCLFSAATLSSTSASTSVSPPSTAAAPCFAVRPSGRESACTCAVLRCLPVTCVRLSKTAGSLRSMRATIASNSTSHASPSPPNTTNTDCQPSSRMSSGPDRSPRMEPTCSPAKMKDTARERSSGGDTRATMSMAAAGAAASPSPTRARDTQRPGTVDASSGTPAVANDHSPTPTGSIVLPPNRLDSHPDGS
mmetsp:Transcript_21603/g.64757  ORF Transcript_21603/g.64757 Transcript_21603/m.64757 type:complete len:208 (+) Transcript_21603:934-1557(+)